jgi:hypothetical protein
MILDSEAVCDACGSQSMVHCCYCDKMIDGKFKAIRLDESSDKKLYFHELCIKCGECGIELGNNIFIRESDKTKLYCEQHRKVDGGKPRAAIKKAPARQLPLCGICNDSSRHHEWTCPKKVKAPTSLPPSVYTPAESAIPKETTPTKNLPSLPAPSSNPKIVTPPDHLAPKETTIGPKVSPVLKTETPPSLPATGDTTTTHSQEIGVKEIAKNNEINKEKEVIVPPTSRKLLLTPSSADYKGKEEVAPKPPTQVKESVPLDVTVKPPQEEKKESTILSSLPILPSPEVKAQIKEINEVVRRKVTISNIVTSTDAPNKVMYAKVLESFANELDDTGAEIPETRLRIAYSLDMILDSYDTSTPSSKIPRPPTPPLEKKQVVVNRETSFLNASPTKVKKSVPGSAVSGTLIKEGYLTKSGKNGKDWKKRWCVLNDIELAYFDSNTSKKANGTVALKGACLRPTKDISEVQPPLPFNFQILDKSRRVWTFCAESDVEMISWFETLASVAGLPVEQLTENLGKLSTKKTAREEVKSIIEEKVLCGINL